MQRFAGSTATFVFFAMAMAGLLTGQPSFPIAVRSLVGAVIAYLVAWLAFKLIVDVMLSVVVADARSHMTVQETEDDEVEEDESVEPKA